MPMHYVNPILEATVSHNREQLLRGREDQNIVREGATFHDYGVSQSVINQMTNEIRLQAVIKANHS